MKKLILKFILSILFFHANLAIADLQSDIFDCLKIQKSSDRLSCYDTVAKYHKTNLNLLPTKTKSKTESNLISPDDTFGQSEKLGPDSIQSRLIGEFKGWKKGMKLILENGQTWKVTSRKSGYKRMTNPVITISRGVFGSFNAKVEGMNAGAKVKRIK